MTVTPTIASFYGLGFPEVLVILVILGCMALWIWMLVDCATKEPKDGVRAAWILVVAVLGIFGALLYLFARKIPRQLKRPNKAPEPTTTSVTPPAAQESRRP